MIGIAFLIVVLNLEGVYSDNHCHDLQIVAVHMRDGLVN